MSEWRETQLGDVLSIEHGFAFPGDGFGDDAKSPQVLTPGNFAVGGGFQPSKPKSYRGEYPARYLLRNRELVVTMTDLSKGGDTLGYAVRLPIGQEFLHNQRIGLVELTDATRLDLDFFGYLTRTAGYRNYILGTASGSTVRHTSPGRIGAFIANLPPLPEQQAIVEVLGALDDKIAANTKLAAVAAQLARASYLRSIVGESRVLEIGELAKLVTRGVTPRYVDETEDGAVLVLNQKCVRDQRVGLDSARWTSQTAIREHKMLERYDLLVNSTGMGTLGRVAPWWRDDAATVDSHITIVRPNADECHPAVIMEAICAVEPRIEALGEGSTGQTELSRVELGKLPIRLPDAHKAEVLGPILEGLAAMSLSFEAENRTLAATRDALLPQLMSGALRVRDLARSEIVG